MYRAMPGTAHIDHDTLCEMGETDQRSLLVAAAAVTGLDPLVDYIEDRLAAEMENARSA